VREDWCGFRASSSSPSPCPTSMNEMHTAAAAAERSSMAMCACMRAIAIPMQSLQRHDRFLHALCDSRAGSTACPPFAFLEKEAAQLCQSHKMARTLQQTPQANARSLQMLLLIYRPVMLLTIAIAIAFARFLQLSRPGHFSLYGEFLLRAPFCSM
jgi:hypothetical protein